MGSAIVPYIGNWLELNKLRQVIVKLELPGVIALIVVFCCLEG